MLSSSLNANVITALLVEEIAYLTLEELIKIYRKKHYVIFFKT